ncbi:uncharacterized protein E0L32_007484 [Thyridium curvatum]|uniref:NWD NACHT-NTPase N-terminal domain-containing protein n=1 Tax=Thyridium curvatum TaxID=1093900 RepID=A0A507AWA5_9PEZI|nr:uncharacterized protein E0L32_007484 [Thyridium curvatum]TPX11747.1 hypothetical protein E0L32_007484 [Thyridium curvatum]
MAAPPSRQTAAARSLHGAEQVDGSADAPATREQSSSSEATENALWDEAYDRMKSTNLVLVEKFEKKAMEAYHKLREGQVSPQDASLHGLAAFPQDAEKRRRLMQDMAQLQLQRTHDDRAQKVRNVVKTAVQLFEVLEKQLSPLFEATPLAGLAFGGLCLVLRTPANNYGIQFAASGITVHEKMMQGLKHIAENSRWYLEKSKSSVFQSKSDSAKVTMSPLREILLNIFSTMLEYQVTSVNWSGRSFFNYFRTNPFPDLLSKLKEAENDFYRKATFDQHEVAQKMKETRRVRSFLKALGGDTLKMLHTEDEHASARTIAEWLVNEPSFKSWEESCTGILSVTTTHQCNPALAKTLASTLKQREGDILAYFTVTPRAGQFSKLLKSLITQIVDQKTPEGDDLASILRYKDSGHDENLLLECFERALATLGCTVRVVFFLDISCTASSELQEGLRQLVGKMFPVDTNTSHLIQVLITSHADVGLNQVLSPKHGGKTTYLLAPPLLPISQAPLSIDTTSSTDAAGPTDIDIA